MQGLTVLSPGDPEVKIDIVFVHGLRGDAINTWTKGQICWPRDLLKVDLPNARILTWGYDSSVAQVLEFASQSSLFGHAENLLTDLVNKRRGESEKTRPMIFVGHSMGGLVIKQVLIRANTMLLNGQDPRRGAIYQCTCGVMFLGTPHRGSDREAQASMVAKIAQLANRQPNRQLLETLASHSHILENQRTAFNSITRDLPIVCLYEEKPPALGLIVPESSACIDGFHVKKNSIMDNHMDMAKFESAESVGYQRALGYILDLVHDIETPGDSASVNLPQYPPLLTVVDYQRDRTVHESLKFDTIDDRFYGVTLQYNQTFEWLFNDNDLGFPEWLQSDCRIFWITGRAGSGKSTLMKYAFKDSRTLRLLKEGDRSSDQPFLAHFFFHGRGTDMQKSFKGLLQSVLHKILERYPKLIPHVLPNHMDKEWSLSTLKASFQKLFTERFHQTLNIGLFVDGLDEFEGDHDEIANFFITNIEHSVHRIHLCVSSRPLPVFLHHFRNCSRIEMHLQTLTDITLYVKEQLDETTQMRILRQSHRSDVDYFIRRIVNKASGVFLWARLAVKTLLEGLNSGEDLNELSSRLDRLPAELSDLFQTMLDGIGPSYAREAAEIFQILSVAGDLPPLHLIFLALDDPRAAMDQSCTKIGFQQLRDRCSTAKLRLRSRCAGLVEVVKYGGNENDLRVQFLHQSVKDFMSQSDTWAFVKTKSRPRFSPSRALLAAVLRSIKCVPSSAYGNSGDYFWLHEFGHYAYWAEDETGEAQTDMLQELNRVCNARHRKASREEAFHKANSHRCFQVTAKQAFLLSDIDNGEYIPADFTYPEEQSEWTDRYFESIGAACNRTGLISYVVWYDIPLSTKSYMLSMPERSEVIDGLLNLRLRRSWWFPVPGSLETFRSLTQHGANPNADVVGVGESTWQYCLNRLYIDFSWRTSFDGIETKLLELLVLSGADIHATIHFDCEFASSVISTADIYKSKAQMSAYAVLKRLSSGLREGERSRMQRILDGMARRGANEYVVRESVPQLSTYVSAIIPDGWPHVLVSMRYRGEYLPPVNTLLLSTQPSDTAKEVPVSSTSTEPRSSSPPPSDTFKEVCSPPAPSGLHSSNMISPECTSHQGTYDVPIPLQADYRYPVVTSPTFPRGNFLYQPAPSLSPSPYEDQYMYPVQPQSPYNLAPFAYHSITTPIYTGAYSQHEHTPHVAVGYSAMNRIHSQSLVHSVGQPSGPVRATTIHRQPSPSAPETKAQGRSLRETLFRRLRKSPSRNL